MIQKTGVYVNKATGEQVEFGFEIPNDIGEFLSLGLSETERNKLAFRMYITDARNTASAQAQAENGHNQRVMTEEQKQANRIKAQAVRKLAQLDAAALRAVGVSEDIIRALGK